MQVDTAHLSLWNRLASPGNAYTDGTRKCREYKSTAIFSKLCSYSKENYEGISKLGYGYIPPVKDYVPSYKIQGVQEYTCQDLEEYINKQDGIISISNVSYLSRNAIWLEAAKVYFNTDNLGEVSEERLDDLHAKIMSALDGYRAWIDSWRQETPSSSTRTLECAGWAHTNKGPFRLYFYMDDEEDRPYVGWTVMPALEDYVPL